jgi:hypothetical protein
MGATSVFKIQMNDTPRRIARERRTVQAMVQLYCRMLHDGGDGLCDDCSTLSAYALARLNACRFADEKPVCNRCPMHCYRSQKRKAIRAVMRFSGPRMLLYHPILALSHLVDSWLARGAAAKCSPQV